MSSHLQTKVLERIVSGFPKKSLAVEKLAEILNIGPDAVYRRLRGDTILSPDELTLLAKKFKISLDAIIYQETDSEVV